jgi:hypothetical protein
MSHIEDRGARIRLIRSRGPESWDKELWDIIRTGLQNSLPTTIGKQTRLVGMHSQRLGQLTGYIVLQLEWAIQAMILRVF